RTGGARRACRARRAGRTRGSGGQRGTGGEVVGCLEVRRVLFRSAGPFEQEEERVPVREGVGAARAGVGERKLAVAGVSRATGQRSEERRVGIEGSYQGHLTSERDIGGI